MSHPREPFDHLFEKYNIYFEKEASKEKECATFEHRAGPNIGRTLRFKDSSLNKGVFLELKDHWMKSDPVDPQVTLAFGAWFRPKLDGFPFYCLTKVYYEGKLSELQAVIEQKLALALCEGKLVTEEIVKRDGKIYEDWPRDDLSAV